MVFFFFFWANLFPAQIGLTAFGEMTDSDGQNAWPFSHMSAVSEKYLACMFEREG